MSLINGLSAAGSAVASTFGNAALAAQQASLLEERDTLASQLAEGKDTRLEQLRQSGAQKLQSSQQEFESGQQTQRLEHESSEGEKTRQAQKDVAGMEIAGAHANVMAQIGAQGWSLQIDQSTGNPIRVNAITGKAAPLTDNTGKPLQVVNTALVPVVQATIDSNNEQLRAENTQYNTQMTTLRSQLTDLYKNPSLMADPDAMKKAQKPIQDQIASLTADHEGVMTSLRSSSAQAAASLYAKGATPDQAKGKFTPPPDAKASSKRPPLSTFQKPSADEP